MSQPINGSFGLAMFRKKRMPTKPGYKLVTIKGGGRLLHNPICMWDNIYVITSVYELEILNGPIISINMDGYNVGRNVLLDYVSEHADVAVWVPEQYLSSIAPGVA